MAEARLDLGHATYLGVNAFGAVAKRMLVTDLGLPEGAPRLDALLPLGRLDTYLEQRITGPLFARASAFVEHSDRDDPIGLFSPFPTHPRLSMGALLSLQATIGAHR